MQNAKGGAGEQKECLPPWQIACEAERDAPQYIKLTVGL
jgi:hypothetical protein